jgi:Asp-tRNA(Asn)/Glu-tRNA(Gln) amidotransferase A subunit family amidase
MTACGGSNDDAELLTSDQQLGLSASAVVTAIREGRLSAVAYLTTLYERADRFSNLNTIITSNRTNAMAAAAQVDAARAAGKTLGPLAGLPILVKDNVNTKDLPTTGGTPALKTFVPKANAPLLDTLLNAGAIVFAKANMQELALGITNTNFSPFAGFARNPYDTTRVPGGSSGGTGAAIAARLAPAGLGSDTGGSVRVPASFNGIAGLRPTTGNLDGSHRYPGKGVIPLSHTLDTVGPMGRTVADIALLDAAITSTAIAAKVPLTNLRFGVPAVFWKDLDTEVAAVMQSARQRLAAAGIIFVDVDMAEIMTLSDKVVFPVALHEPITELPAYLADSGATGITIQSIAEQVASPDVRNAFQSVVQDSFAAAYPDAINIYLPQLRKMYADYLSNNRLDAIFFPTVPVLPPKIDPVNGTGTISVNGGPQVDAFTTVIRNMAPGSCAGVPSLTVPAGLSASGLPVGLNIEGPVGGDQRLLGIGLSIEAVLGSLPLPKL